MVVNRPFEYPSHSVFIPELDKFLQQLSANVRLQYIM